jgi:two-component system, cell cycle response regulator
MSSVASRTLYRTRTLLLDRYAFLLVLGAVVLLARGDFADLRLEVSRAAPIAVAGLLGLVLLGRLLLGRPVRTSSRERRIDRVENGLLLLSFAFALVQATGGPGEVAQPVVFLVVAYLVGFNERAIGLGLTGFALALQATLHHAAGDLLPSPGRFALQGGLLVGFALANLAFLQAEVLRRRREHERRIASEVQAMRDEARDFRLISSALSRTERRDRSAEENKISQGAVEGIHQTMYFVLELLKKSLGLQTCVLLWLDESGRHLRIKELVTDSSLIREVPIPAKAGAIASVLKDRLLLNLRRPRHGARGIPYYSGPEEVGAFLAVPVLEGGHLRGALCADRRQDQPFSEGEEQVMVEATRQVLRAIQNERVFGAVEKSKYELERFYRASALLNHALTLAQVYDTALAAAREIVEFEFGAITLFDRARRRHIICRATDDREGGLEGQDFGENAGLVSMVVKNKHFLPADEDVRGKDTVLFARKLGPRGLESLAVFPLIAKDEVIGTFVVASRQRGRLSGSVRDMLSVISNQVAVSVENAKMYKQMEEMATTDGLTGLPNHRTFQARMSEMLHRAERYQKPLAVVLTDIDKFKNVNDTYGHPVGDIVLKRVAKVLEEQARKIDLVARYGGEEFVMVLEDTDARGARLFCERVRQEIAAQLMSSEKGPFRVTLSLGIASYPVDGAEKKELVDRADQSLYAAKDSGRNRTVCYGEVPRLLAQAKTKAAP